MDAVVSVCSHCGSHHSFFAMEAITIPQYEYIRFCFNCDFEELYKEYVNVSRYVKIKRYRCEDEWVHNG